MGNISYFLGCSSSEGFHSFFGELCPTHSGGYTYIIKGGPGTGKSSLMKRINSALIDAGIETELIYCSSDPASLDGVYAPALNCWIADGTSPHTLEPKYPGAAQETVDLGRFWKKDILRSRAAPQMQAFSRSERTAARGYTAPDARLHGHGKNQTRGFAHRGARVRQADRAHRRRESQNDIRRHSGRDNFLR